MSDMFNVVAFAYALVVVVIITFIAVAIWFNSKTFMEDDDIRTAMTVGTVIVSIIGGGYGWWYLYHKKGISKDDQPTEQPVLEVYDQSIMQFPNKI